MCQKTCNLLKWIRNSNLNLLFWEKIENWAKAIDKKNENFRSVPEFELSSKQDEELQFGSECKEVELNDFKCNV